MSNKSSQWLTKRGIKIGFLNICYLQNKIDELPNILSNYGNNFHLFGIAETHIKNNITSDTELLIPGYHKPIRKDPSKQLETGLLMYYSTNILTKRRTDFESFDIESIWVEISFKQNKPLYVGFIYRNPAESVSWYCRFNSMMEKVSAQGIETIILGDINIDIFKQHSTWKRIYEQYNLTQILNSPTRIAKDSSTLIDHIYTTSKDHIIESSSHLFGNSDHNAICLTWSKKGLKYQNLDIQR